MKVLVGHVEPIGNGLELVILVQPESHETVAQLERAKPGDFKPGQLVELTAAALVQPDALELEPAPATAAEPADDADDQVVEHEPGAPVPAIACEACGVTHYQGEPEFETHRDTAPAGVRVLPYAPPAR